MTSDTQHISGKKGGVIRFQRKPLALEGCRGVTVLEPEIEGGYNNIEFLNCTDCHVVGGTCADPVPVLNPKTGMLDDPEDPISHCILFNECTDCSVIRTTCISSEETGDKVNFYGGKTCTAKDVTIIGPVGKKGTAAIIDGPSGKGHLFLRLMIETVGNVNVCGGSGHTLKNFTLKAPLAWTAEYYINGYLKGGLIEDVSGPRIYFGTGIRKPPKVIRCQFKVYEGDIAAKQALPRKPAGWSENKFCTWLRKKGWIE